MAWPAHALSSRDMRGGFGTWPLWWAASVSETCVQAAWYLSLLAVRLILVVKMSLLSRLSHLFTVSE
eukprot:CAMPEP_0181234064 /NCGR_PEP_ID=MMETSP1096-20121128/36726_1 /TAXON_ID=156174 ORGANISM="Chrysochromulina ericina, Strain CCMP281" /NCGR_SAMPLE_ID=MMETSP1096 /ASSEMBLY_ACC=CAM_ASM_000453 /LENGTH=66 /DNA_ID=CAMNT_0023328719 /DNA_START=112 /DNA_END=309 /DNA_ORIENTATION=-